MDKSTQPHQPHEELVTRLKDLIGPDAVFVHKRRLPPDEDPSGTVHETRPMPNPALPANTDRQQDSEGSASTSRYTCDRCDLPIKDIRLKCQVCPNFDYCPGCHRDAARIHPGHKFAAFMGAEEAKPGNYRFAMIPAFEAMMGLKFPLLEQKEAPEQPQHICRSCKPAFTATSTWHYVLSSEKATKPGADRALEASGIEWEVRITRLAEATALGCAFCAYILEKFFGPQTIWSSGYNAKRPWYLKADGDDQRRAEVLEHAMELSTLLPNDRVWFKLAPKVTRERPLGAPRLEKIRITAIRARAKKELHKKLFAIAGNPTIELQAFASRRNPASDTATDENVNVAKLTPNPEPGSSESLTQVRTWFHECVEHHGHFCSAPSEARRLPTRVIEMLEASNLRIKETMPDDIGPYCVLSYQWGGSQKFQLTTASVGQLREGFSIDETPSTIADAIKITQSLGIRYLWVDALCILQDSETDKAEEIARMGEIYQQAALTIIAANAPSVRTGFLRPNTDPDSGEWPSLIPLMYPVVPTNQLSAELQERTPDSSSLTDPLATPEKKPITWQALWLMDDMEELSYNTYRDPVASRSWCLQERLLSPRVLNYSHWPTWRCSRSTVSDGGFYLSGDPNVAKTDDFTRLFLHLSRQRAWQQQQQQQQPPNNLPLSYSLEHTTLHTLLTAWSSLVAEYTRRQLSDPRDRLRAISGIASLISRLTGMQYVVGLWRENMLHDLMWFAEHREWLNRPAGWHERVPTWSWGSVTTPVEYGDVGEERKVPVAVVTRYPRVPEGGASELRSGMAVFADLGVEAGEVRIRGPLASVGRKDVLALLREQGLDSAVPETSTLLEFMRRAAELVDRNVGARGVGSGEKMEDDEEGMPPGEVFVLVTYRHGERSLDGKREVGRFWSGLVLVRKDEAGEGGRNEEGGGEGGQKRIEQQAVGHGWYERIGSFRKAPAVGWLDVDAGCDTVGDGGEGGGAWRTEEVRLR